ncbi:hypothetical protein LQ938_09720 [Microbacterium sp. cx-55]|uniref:hypothetical protein n=1 Tax=Microbacterium sp. cx-55 TaxID=2875948 RepID=UPI001CBA8F90|nr:hypothetical protein [Microbacterium sp. cx-55]MBZ4485961.1 hypothetical protein [Microbacterium sp. cx-55]UGB34165.1 hypothetical protein LQ938_09720 [Microbacterium sp. cx-55]
MAIDFNTLTMGEIARIEKLGGVPVSTFASGNVPLGAPMAALALVLKNREDKAYTWNDAQSLTFPEVAAILGTDTDDTDTTADATALETREDAPALEE